MVWREPACARSRLSLPVSRIPARCAGAPLPTRYAGAVLMLVLAMLVRCEKK